MAKDESFYSQIVVATNNRQGQFVLAAGYTVFAQPQMLTIRNQAPLTKWEDRSGWVIGLSLPLSDVPAAAGVVAKVFARSGANTFQLRRPDPLVDAPLDIASADQPAILLHDAGEKNWPQILAAIERGFMRQGLSAGPALHGQRQVRSSRYSYYRHDGSDKGALEPYEKNEADFAQLWLRKDETYFNPAGKYDPLAAVTLPEPAMAGDQQFLFGGFSHALDNRVFGVDSRVVGRKLQYLVRVDPTLSRDLFAREFGIARQGLEREALGAGMQQIVVPVENLPQMLQAAAILYYSLAKKGVEITRPAILNSPDAAQRAFTFSVPETYSRSVLVNHGFVRSIDDVERDKTPDANYPCTHRLTIPMVKIHDYRGETPVTASDDTRQPARRESSGTIRMTGTRAAL